MESAMNSLSISPSGSSGDSSDSATASPKVLPNTPKLLTNVYKVRSDKRAIHRYSVSIDKIVNKPGKEAEVILLSRAGGQDSIRIPRERACCSIIGHLSKGWSDTYFLYEGSAILFTDKEIPMVNKKIAVTDVESLIEERAFKTFIRDATELIVKITPDTRMYDITELVKKSNEENMMIVDFLAALSRKHAPDTRFVAYRGGKLIDNENVKEMSLGQMRLGGISMGVRAVRDEKEGVPSMALDIDVTEATLYREQYLSQSICDSFRATQQQLKEHYTNRETMREVEKYIRDIPVRCEHTNKVFTVTGFKWDENHNLMPWSSAVCKDEEFVKKYPYSAIVTEEFRGKDGNRHERCYPLDSIWVLAGTRVPKEKQRGTKPKPMLPQQRYNAMQKARRDIHIDAQNEAMTRFGTSIDQEPILVDQKRLDPPKMMGVAGGLLKEIRVDSIKHNWRSDNYKFVKGAKIDEIFFTFQTGGFLDEKKASEFTTALIKCCKEKGMAIGRFNANPKALSNVGDLRVNMEEFAAYRDEKRMKDGQEEYRVVYILLGDKNVDWHDTLKLLEQQKSVLTQHIFADTVRKILTKSVEQRSRDFTTFNIAMKTNIKGGGVNFKIGHVVGGNTLFPSADQMTLIVGLDVAHPPSLSRQQVLRGIPMDPSCIGISSNCMTSDLQAFTGYEVYTESRREAATDTIMSEVGVHLIRSFLANQGRLPTNIVYFRDGVDKGQYSRVKDEFDWMIEGMRDHLSAMERDGVFNPREVIVLATKRHNMRAYEKTKTGVQNVRAGTVIDMGIVSPYYPEFFLYASHALIGTAKGVQCTILRDTSEDDHNRYPEGKLKDMEKFVHALAFDHQICDSPTSLPEPLYNAHETAKRGSANYKAHRNSLEVRELISTEELTKKLSNRYTELGKLKYNA